MWAICADRPLSPVIGCGTWLGQKSGSWIFDAKSKTYKADLAVKPLQSKKFTCAKFVHKLMLL
jgi:hypothetical protein